MTARKPDEPRARDDRSFAELIGEFDDVVPIEGDPPVRRGATREPGAIARTPLPPAVHQPLHHPNPDEPLVAHRSFVRRRLLRALRSGTIRPDRTLDLHGHDRRRAEKLVHETLRDAQRSGERCVLVVVGRGRRSVGGVPVLRDELPRWLCDASLERIVAAFAPAITRDGGRGALYVLLT